MKKVILTILTLLATANIFAQNIEGQWNGALDIPGQLAAQRLQPLQVAAMQNQGVVVQHMGPRGPDAPGGSGDQRDGPVWVVGVGHEESVSALMRIPVISGTHFGTRPLPRVERNN